MTTAQAAWLNDLQALVTNRLEIDRLQGQRVAAILGDVPSTYAKSPKLWNAAFRALELPAIYVPLDVPQGRLADVVQQLRASDQYLGGSVTVPYKVEIMPLLDRLDPLAERIGAVNVIARSADGTLTGYNTDGLGGLNALVAPVLAGSRRPALDLAGARVLLIGSGGAAQAVAFFFWEQMARGELTIANRTLAPAEALVKRLGALRTGALRAVSDAALNDAAAKADLIINASVKGQAGIRKLPDGRWTCLEPYSALAPAEPVALSAMPGQEASFWAAWFEQARQGIVHNQEQSLELCARLPKAALCYDIIYAPLETVFLRHARWSGHPAVNGKEMNIVQAVEAFMRHVCPEWLQAMGVDLAAAHPKVAHAMAEEWTK